MAAAVNLWSATAERSGDGALDFYLLADKSEPVHPRGSGLEGAVATVREGSITSAATTPWSAAASPDLSGRDAALDCYIAQSGRGQA